MSNSLPYREATLSVASIPPPTRGGEQRIRLLEARLAMTLFCGPYTLVPGPFFVFMVTSSLSLGGGAHPETFSPIRFCTVPGHDQENPGGEVSPPLRTEAGKKKQ
jgi:hypothetical protein